MISEYRWPSSRQTDWRTGVEILRVLDAFHRLWLTMLAVVWLLIGKRARCVIVSVINVHIIIAAVQIERVNEAADS
jgi:hypothetical protein